MQFALFFLTKIADNERVKRLFIDKFNYVKYYLNMEIIEKTKVYTSIESALTRAQDVSMHLIILYNSNISFVPDKPICEMAIFGKTVKEWVRSCNGGRCRTTEIEYSSDNNITDLIRPYLSNDKYTIVLYADTPLVRYSSIISILEEMDVRGQNVKKLKRGYIFNTEFIKTAPSVYAPEQQTRFDDEFYTVIDSNTFMVAYNILKQRILAYHLSNGVVILNESSVLIDAEVEIESGVIIHQNNVLLGGSFVKSGTVLYPNNVIKNSFIGSNCTLLGGYLENAKVQNGTVIEPFSKIIL